MVDQDKRHFIAARLRQLAEEVEKAATPRHVLFSETPMSVDLETEMGWGEADLDLFTATLVLSRSPEIWLSYEDDD